MRVFFPKGKQRKFINGVISHLSIKEIAKLCNFSERTIRDWRREKFLVDFKSLKIICKKTGLKIPPNIKLRDRYWYTTKGARKGGLAVFKKYGRIGGNPEYRKKKWYEWWEREGKYKTNIISLAKPINKPNFSEKLAEFVGIILGDGGISKSQITITLHSENDKEYSRFVVNLIKKLFNVYIGTCHRKDSKATSYNISRTKLIHFCIEKLGLKQGNKIKQQVDIPEWIKKNKLYSIACVRGLVDTDGCIFTHRYKSKGKWYSYKKLSFTSYSEPLRQSVFRIFRNNKLNPRFAQRRDVRLDSIKDMHKYFRIIDSHNPNHLKRYKN